MKRRFSTDAYVLNGRHNAHSIKSGLTETEILVT
ncbi:hypothetical protein T11_4075 [Trichinella zimbabwensis]|uniref:Uncharacterized protein n=1 Tax=Trichinella zimbabwensis TaxID=268475 RepID=A0A0V1DMM7_9BILA|nr:hypothetical protein T11_4075 [Trichinella zimbabwensis]